MTTVKYSMLCALYADLGVCLCGVSIVQLNIGAVLHTSNYFTKMQL